MKRLVNAVAVVVVLLLLNVAAPAHGEAATVSTQDPVGLTSGAHSPPR